MRCPSCGTDLPNGSAFCGSCGHQFDQETKRPSNNASKLIPLTFLLTVVLLVISILLPLTTGILDIPVVNMAFTISGDSVEDMKDNLDNLKDDYKDIENRFEESEDLLSKKEAKVVKKIMKASKKVVNTPSLLNVNKLIKVVDKTADQLDDGNDIIDTRGLTDGIEDIQSVIGIIIAVVIVMFILPTIFTLLGGFKKSKVLTILALVFMVIPQLLLCGILWVLLSLVVYILQAVLCHKAKHG